MPEQRADRKFRLRGQAPEPEEFLDRAQDYVAECNESSRRPTLHGLCVHVGITTNILKAVAKSKMYEQCIRFVMDMLVDEQANYASNVPISMMYMKYLDQDMKDNEHTLHIDGESRVNIVHMTLEERAKLAQYATGLIDEETQEGEIVEDDTDT